MALSRKHAYLKVKELKKSREKLAIMRKRLANKETELKEFLASGGSAKETANRARRELTVRRTRLAEEAVEKAADVRGAIFRNLDAQLEIRVDNIK